LRERFIAAGASGDTARKGVAFFMRAAKYAELQVSPFVAGRSRPRIRPTPRRPAGNQKVEGDNNRIYETNELRTWREMLVAKLPEFDTEWSPEIKSKWFDAFDRLIKWIESADKNQGPS
jgi:hypothetical protein